MLGRRPDGLPESVFVHALAFVESAEIGPETRIWGFAHVMKNARVGARCNLGEHVFVEGGAVVGDDVTIKNGVSVWDRVQIGNAVFVGPAAVFTNDIRPRSFIKRGSDAFLPTRIEPGATIGAGAVVVCGIVIGTHAFVAAGAVVTREVPPFAVVRGNPARISAYTCRCARTFFPLGATGGECAECGTENRRTTPG